MKLNINWIQLNAGKSTPIFESTETIDYVQENWFNEIKRFLNKCNAKIIVKHIWKPILMRERDEVIMDNIMKYTESTKIRKIINNWRLYFQVNVISEMINYSGEKILKDFLVKSEPKKYVSQSRLRWPIQIMPNINTFKYWNSYIRNIIECDKYGKLYKPLGVWYDNRIINKVIKIKCWIHKSDTNIIKQDIITNYWYIHERYNIIYGKSYFNKKGEKIKEKPVLDEYSPADIEITRG
jgi:hypothetical protein